MLKKFYYFKNKHKTR